MRNSYIVSYDISDPKRLRQVFQTMRGWGDHLQYSVFECDLDPRQARQLEARFTHLVNPDDRQRGD